MKRLKTIIAFVAGLLTGILLFPCPSLAEDLTAQIFTNPDQDVLPMEVEFSAQVSGGTPPYSYVWSFGDGGSSVNAEESHYYRDSGTYTVSLTIVDSQGGFTVAQKQAVISAMVFDENNVTYTHYTNTDEIQAIIVDKDDPDVLWIGTSGGLVRKNITTGEKTIYTQELPVPYAKCLLQTTDGAIWVGTAEGGIARLDYDINQWTVYDRSNSYLPRDYVCSLIQTDDGTIWAGTWGGGIARLDYSMNQWTIYNTSNSSIPHNCVGALIQTYDGNVWIGTGNGLASLDYRSGQWAVYYSENCGMPGNWVYTLMQAGDNSVWIGTANSGLARLDYGSNQWIVYNTDNSSLPNNSIRTLIQADDGAIWIGAYEGLIRLDHGTNQWTIFVEDNSNLPSNYVSSLFQAKDGMIWVGTGKNGLAKLDYGDNQWTSYDVSSTGLPDNCVQPLIQTEDCAIWLGMSNGNGLVRLDYINNQWILYNKSNCALPNNFVWSLIETDDGAIWSGTWGGLARLDYGSTQWTVYSTSNSALPDGGAVWSLLQTEDGAIWVGTLGGGLARLDYDSNVWNLYNTSSSNLSCNRVISLIQAEDGSIWIGTEDGLSKFDYDTNLWTLFNTDNSSLPSNMVLSLLQHRDGSIWIGTDHGLAKLDHTASQWTVYDTDNSNLPNNKVLSLIQTQFGSVWAGTYSGLIRFDQDANHWNVFLPHYRVKSIMETKDGAYWAGTELGGLVRLSFPSSSKSPGKAVIVAGGGAAKTNTLWSTTEEIARSAYRIFHARGFKNTDIYLMSPDTWCDFNGDGFDDHVVDCPPSNEDRDPAISDVEYAITDWAVTNYTEDTPLFVYLIDHGYSDDGNGPYFQVSSGENLYASQLDEFLDAYEAATGGQVVVVNESCYSGEFLAGLKKSGRVVVSSAGADLVKYTSTGANSFSNFFLKHLYNNQSLSQAFSLAAQDLKIYASTQDQTPWMDDNGDGLCDVSDGLLASQIKLGGDFVLGASWPEILGAECGACISGTAVLTATVSANMNRVWAEIEPPGYEPDDSQGFIHLDLPFINLADSDGDLVYTGEYGGFTQTGVYVVSLFAKDHYGNTTTWDPINVPIGLDDKGSVTGSVKIVFTDNDAVSVQAAAGAVTVRIAGTDCQAQVDSNGDFTIYGVSPGEYTVIISSAGFDSVEVSGVSVTVGETSALGSVELPVQTSQAIPCDMNNDGRRDVKDALEIIQEAVGN